MATERTIQDLLDEMTPEQRDLQAIIVGAAVEDQVISGDETLVAQYEALPAIQKHLIHFLVGNILAERKLEHSNPLVDNFLSHYGVKGMRWGFQKHDPLTTNRLSKSSENTSGERRLARARVKAGSANMAEAHMAALKSNGHRTINAFTGDKTFWKRMGIAAGVTAGLVGASLGVSAFPESLLSAVGESIAGPGIGGSGVHVNKAGDVATNKGIGEMVVKLVLIPTAYATAAAATVANVAGNTTRAVRGNAKIDSSFNALGNNLRARQTEGSQQTRKMLVAQGSLRNKDLKHDVVVLEEFLAHHADKSLKLAQKDT